MTVRPHQTFSELRSELATTKWLLAQARTRLAALEVVGRGPIASGRRDEYEAVQVFEWLWY